MIAIFLPSRNVSLELNQAQLHASRASVQAQQKLLFKIWSLVLKGERGMYFFWVIEARENERFFLLVLQNACIISLGRSPW
jgi:hypothetical protein